MIKKAIDLFEKNPVIIAFYFIYELLLILILVLLYPNNMTSFAVNGSFDFAEYFMTMSKMLSACVLIILLYSLFIPGFGYMLSEAVMKGKTSAQAFLEGINKFFVRFLLLMLLSIAATMACSIIISIILVPITIFQVMGGGANGLGNMSLFIIVFILIIALFISPFVLLCTPSILMEDIKIVQGIKNGVKAGIKNYWKLFVIMLPMYLPILIYEIVFYEEIRKGNFVTPSYFILLILSCVVSFFIFPILFMIYKEYLRNNK